MRARGSEGVASKADLVFSFHKGSILLSTLKLSPKPQKTSEVHSTCLQIQKYYLSIEATLTFSIQRPLSYRNQSIDLGSKSMGWFLYDNGLGLGRVKALHMYISVIKVSFANQFKRINKQFINQLIL